MSKNSIAEEARLAYIETELKNYKSISSSNESDLKSGEYLEKSTSKCDLIYRDKQSGKLVFIEIKSTASATGKCFGAITASEIECALNNRENYFFVICVKNGETWTFDVKYTVKELFRLKLLTIPPIKFYFNLPTSEKVTNAKNKFKKTTIVACEEVAKMYLDLRKQIINGID